MLSRRHFLTNTAMLGSAAGFAATPLSSAVAAAVDDLETTTWSCCSINCGSRCLLRCVSKKGRVIRIETDNTGDPEAGASATSCPQVRACQRGRSIRQRLYSEERLKFPMKRVGRRGEGKFERISWEQALDEIAARLKKTIAEHTNESIMLMHGSGSYSLFNNRNCTFRFFNMIGGNIGWYSDYSAACIQHAWPYLYGGFGYGGVRSTNDGAGSYMNQVKNAKLYVTFGNNPAVTRASGGGQSWELYGALREGKSRMVVIDPICTDTLAGRDAEWVAIRPGTDAALCEGMAWVMINENLVDQAFLDKYCVGYDEKTLPKSAPKGSDYKSYILGQGPDKTAKTPLWASRITQVPVETIERLAREIATTKPVFISQGWGPQRRMNGETQSTAIAMMALLTGQVGLPGTNSGAREGDSYGIDTGLPTGKNPIGKSFPIFLWPRAVKDAKGMTALNAGVRGCDRLEHNIKFIWNTQGNTLVNQHGGVNQIREILEDEKLVETIVVVDNQMTPSARFADYVLPDTMNQEIADMQGDAYAVGDYNYIVACPKAADILWEQKPNYWIMTEMAKRFGLEEKFTEGRTQKEWIRWGYEQTLAKAAKQPDPIKLPGFDEFWAKGFVKYHMGRDSGIVLKAFREDPEKHPLKTPSGRIEIYSERLANIAKNWVLPKGDVISPIPMFVRTWEMPGDALQKKYPLQCYGYHGHGRIHSTFHNLPALREQFPDEVLVNVLDADARGIRSGDRVRVFNDRGAVELVAKVTPRIIPGVVSIPQGAWYRPVMKDGRRVDVGGNINTLTSLRPSPLAKGNPQHTNLVEVVKA